jgi:hypothetical protein
MAAKGNRASHSFCPKLCASDASAAHKKITAIKPPRTKFFMKKFSNQMSDFTLHFAVNTLELKSLQEYLKLLLSLEYLINMLPPI